jgi:hypothetical protein
VPKLLIVEGVGAALACAGYVSAAIVLQVPRSVREARWRQRDGALTEVELRWLDQEDAYLRTNPFSALSDRLDCPVLTITHGGAPDRQHPPDRPAPPGTPH